MSSEWDPEVVQHLQHARAAYEAAEVVQVVHAVVKETWKANLARWSPSAHFDDTNTLGYQTSRNVNNRLVAAMQHAEAFAPGTAETESGILVARIKGFRLRVVKAPIESGATPDFQTDFDWSASLSRAAAAQRNQAVYYPMRGAGTLAYETDPRPEHLRQVERCRDVFLIWAAELTSTRTLGWLGLPSLGDLPWMGVIDLWRDDEEAAVNYVWDDDDPED